MYDLRELINQHPEFKDKLQIVPRFPLKNRPQLFIHLTGSTATFQRLSPDNFLGEVESYVQLFYINDKPGSSIEWVKEDPEHLDQLVAPGVYYVSIVDAGHFTVEPVYEVMETLYREYYSGKSDPHFQVAQVPVRDHIDIIAGSAIGDSIFLKEGVEFTLDRTTGQGVILPAFESSGWDITIRYWTGGPVTDSIEFNPNTATNSAIPGVILAFGRRSVVGDVQAIRVFPKRSLIGAALGGKWELSVDIDAWALDPDTVSEVMDFLALSIWGVLFQRYTSEGIAVTTFNIGGEAEETYDANTEQSWFLLNSTFTALCDWELVIPYPYQVVAIRGVTIPDEELTQGRTISPVVQKPLLVSHSYNYERLI